MRSPLHRRSLLLCFAFLKQKVQEHWEVFGTEDIMVVDLIDMES